LATCDGENDGLARATEVTIALFASTFVEDINPHHSETHRTFLPVDHIGTDQGYRRLDHALSETPALGQPDDLQNVLFRLGRINDEMSAAFSCACTHRLANDRTVQVPIELDGAFRAIDGLLKHGRVPRHLGQQSKADGGCDVGQGLGKPVLSAQGWWFVAVELERIFVGHIRGHMSNLELILHDANVSAFCEATSPLR
jgi:hypothetical protein